MQVPKQTVFTCIIIIIIMFTNFLAQLNKKEPFIILLYFCKFTEYLPVRQQLVPSLRCCCFRSLRRRACAAEQSDASAESLETGQICCLTNSIELCNVQVKILKFQQLLIAFFVVFWSFIHSFSHSCSQTDLSRAYRFVNCPSNWQIMVWISVRPCAVAVGLI